MAKLHFIAEYLVKYEVMDGEQFVYVMEHDDVCDEDLLSMIESRKKKSEEENRKAKEEEEEALARLTVRIADDDDDASAVSAEENTKGDTEEIPSENNEESTPNE